MLCNNNNIQPPQAHQSFKWKTSSEKPSKLPETNILLRWFFYIVPDLQANQIKDGPEDVN